MSATLKVFYRDEQTVSDLTSFSPSAGKPAKVVDYWLRQNLPISLESFAPLTEAQLCLAHDPQFVSAVLSGGERNGFGNTNTSVAQSLAYTSGSMVAATLDAFRTAEICASPTSGFHHAGFQRASDFCTFNGLIIAARVLHESEPGADAVIGILDMDQHYGDGTDEIIEHLGLSYLRHWSLGANSSSKYDADLFFREQFAEILEQHFGEAKALIYQAGADPWINDPLGGRFTKEQLRLRDQMVFEFCRAQGIGCAFNLAGGYARNFQDVLDIHNNTMVEALIACDLLTAEDRRRLVRTRD
jgi:acetoin utilization deacetylase AcuC-like enzyme